MKATRSPSASGESSMPLGGQAAHQQQQQQSETQIAYNSPGARQVTCLRGAYALMFLSIVCMRSCDMPRKPAALDVHLTSG